MNLRITILGFILFASAGCQTNLLQNALTGTSDNATEDAVVTTMSMTQSGGEEAAHVAAINEVLDASVEEIPTISTVGYAVVSSQPGRSENQRRLMAIRAARMAASLSKLAKSAPVKPGVLRATLSRSTSLERVLSLA